MDINVYQYIAETFESTEVAIPLIFWLAVFIVGRVDRVSRTDALLRSPGFVLYYLPIQNSPIHIFQTNPHSSLTKSSNQANSSDADLSYTV